MLNIGTFCSGIGSPEQALKNLGINHTVKFACEIDKYARITYESNHKAEIFYKDLTTLDFNTLPDIDLFVAGFPCQAFSIAGKREGFNDTRGTIFFHIQEYLRIKRPKYFILENVKGLLSSKSLTFNCNTFDVIIKSLAKSVNGTMLMFTAENSINYHIYYKVINATNHGIPQNRERVFIVGFRDDSHSFKFPENELLKLRLKDLLEDNVNDKYFLSEKALHGLLNHKEKHNNNGNGFGANILDVNKSSSTIGTTPGSRDRNLISPTIKSRYYKDGSECLITVIPSESVGQRVYNHDGVSVCLSANGGGQGAKTGLYATPVLTPNRPEKRQNGRRFKNDGDSMFTLIGQDLHGIYDGHKVRRLTPRECFRLMGFPDTFDISKVSETQAYKQAGNSIVVNVIQELIENILVNERE